MWFSENSNYFLNTGKNEKCYFIFNKSKTSTSSNLSMPKLEDVIFKSKNKAIAVLEVRGVGYSVIKNSKNKILEFKLGKSHKIFFDYTGINVDISVHKSIIQIYCSDYVLLKQICSKIEKLYYPDPYKKKGIFILGKD
jgi:hypothetical protein